MENNKNNKKEQKYNEEKIEFNRTKTEQQKPDLCKIEHIEILDI